MQPTDAQRLRITSVTEGGIASRLGLRAGDYIESLNGADLLENQDLTAALSANANRIGALRYWREGVGFNTIELAGSSLGIVATPDNPAERVRREMESKALPERLARIVLATTSTIDGRHCEVIGLATAICDYDNSGLIVKGTSFQAALAECQQSLRKQAVAAGADAVLGVTLSSSVRVSGSTHAIGSSQLLLQQGTLVRFV